jgi:hypothetical protein
MLCRPRRAAHSRVTHRKYRYDASYAVAIRLCAVRRQKRRVRGADQAVRAAHPFRSATVDELLLDDDYHRRPLRPEDFEFLKFMKPVRPIMSAAFRRWRRTARCCRSTSLESRACRAAAKQRSGSASPSSIVTTSGRWRTTGPVPRSVCVLLSEHRHGREAWRLRVRGSCTHHRR